MEAEDPEFKTGLGYQQDLSQQNKAGNVAQW